MSDIFIRPDVQKLIDMSAEASAPRLSEIGAVEGRSLMRTMQSEFDLPVGDLAMQSDVTMEASDDGRLISLRVYDSRESTRPGPGAGVLPRWRFRVGRSRRIRCSLR